MAKEIKKGESWRLGYQQGCKETAKAFGGCTECYGKGYATTLEFTEGGVPDFENDVISRHEEGISRHRLPIMRFCTCGRGRQLQKLIKQEYEKE